jgi:hypothetical protein
MSRQLSRGDVTRVKCEAAILLRYLKSSRISTLHSLTEAAMRAVAV